MSYGQNSLEEIRDKMIWYGQILKVANERDDWLLAFPAIREGWDLQ